MTGTVKWFNNEKGYGFITYDGDKDVFVHYSNIIDMEGFKALDTDDIVDFEIGEGTKQAINVRPVITMRMISSSLKDEHLYVKKMENNLYLVVDSDDIIQSPEYGMSFEELAEYAGFSVSES